MKSMDKKAYSTQPPKGLKREETLQFFTIGFDDNGDTEQLEWILQLAKKYKNSDGSPIGFSFYNNGNFKDAIPLWEKLHRDGHEIGDHTYSHGHGCEIDWTIPEPECTELMDKKAWLEEIEKNREVLRNINPKIEGFRTPFLEFTNSTFEAIQEAGYTYDCSIEEGYQTGMRPGEFYWPYDLKDGSPGDEFCCSGVKGKEGIKSYPGLWEMPVYVLEIPEDKYAKEYGFNPGLRDRVDKEKSYIKDSGWKITGFDWNMWYTDDGKEWLEAKDVLGLIKYNIDLFYHGNRTPIMFGAHIDLYNKADRRWVIEETIKYVLSKKSTRITPVQNILKWIKN